MEPAACSQPSRPISACHSDARDLRARSIRGRRVQRAIARRRRATSSVGTGRRYLPTITVSSLSEAEKEQRLLRLAAYLVKTMRACPAPGIAPLTTGDWLLIASVATLPFLVVFVSAAVAGVR
jgi:hypothetical protein